MVPFDFFEVKELIETQVQESCISDTLAFAELISDLLSQHI